MYISVKEAAIKWGISERRVRKLCEEGKISGSFKEGKFWRIPQDVPKPQDGRIKKAENLLPIIDKKFEELKKRRPFTEGEASRLMEDFMIESTYNSNAIEGNTLTLRETDLVLRGFTIDQKPLKDHIEAVSHKEAFCFILDLVKEKPELTESIIKQIHFLVLGDKVHDRGVYRKVPVKIIESSYEPVQPYLIEPKMNQLITDYKESKEHFITRLAKFHIEFERIHAFIDGNGRTGRLLVNLELMKAGFPPIDIKFSDRIRYYNAFEKYSDGEGSEGMEFLFVEYVDRKLDEYLGMLKG